MASRATLPHPFRSWLHRHPLDVLAQRVGVTKTTIRAWRTARGFPSASRYAKLKALAARDGVTLTTDHLLPTRTK